LGLYGTARCSGEQRAEHHLVKVQTKNNYCGERVISLVKWHAHICFYAESTIIILKWSTQFYCFIVYTDSTISGAEWSTGFKRKVLVDRFRRKMVNTVLLSTPTRPLFLQNGQLKHISNAQSTVSLPEWSTH